MKSKNKLLSKIHQKNLYHIKNINLSNGNNGGKNGLNENVVLKTDPNNQCKLNNLINNNRSHYLSNSYINDLVKRKINLKKRNTFTNSTFIDKKRNSKANTFELICPLNEFANNSSKVYTNPFAKTSDKNKIN